MLDGSNPCIVLSVYHFISKQSWVLNLQSSSSEGYNNERKTNQESRCKCYLYQLSFHPPWLVQAAHVRQNVLFCSLICLFNRPVFVAYKSLTLAAAAAASYWHSRKILQNKILKQFPYIQSYPLEIKWATQVNANHPNLLCWITIQTISLKNNFQLAELIGHPSKKYVLKPCFQYIPARQ